MLLIYFLKYIQLIIVLEKLRLDFYISESIIINNNITHWDSLDLDLINKLLKPLQQEPKNNINLFWFDNWISGFTTSEGSFGIKSNNSAFYTIRQTGLENKILIEAIQLRFGRINTIKPDSNNSYKITFSSKIDIQKVIDFFFFHPPTFIL